MRRSLSALLFVSLAIMLVPGLARADDSKDFKVSSFIPEKFSDLEWKIGGRFNLYGADYEQDIEVAPGFDYQDLDSDRSRNAQNLNFDTDALYVYETVKRQFELRLSFSGDLSHRGDDDNGTRSQLLNNYTMSWDNERDQLSYRVATSIRTSVRQYLGDNWFGELSLSNSYYNNQVAYDDWYSSSVEIRQIEQNIRVDRKVRDQRRSSGQRNNIGSFSIAFGLGHVYEGSFASVAMHIIDELEEADLLRDDPSKSQMLELTEIVYYYQMKHIIDDRIHRQEALNSIIAFLEDESLVHNLGSEVLYAIQDIWDYYPSRKRTPRQFGFRIKAGLGYLTAYEGQNRSTEEVRYRLLEEYDPADPSVIDTLENSFSSYNSSDHESYTDEIPYFTASAEYHLPISHLWQFDASAVTDINLENTKRQRGRRVLRNSKNRFQTRFVLTRILDSRTTITTILSTDLYFNRSDAEANPSDITYPDTRRVWDTDLRITAQCDITYRLAIPTTLSLKASFGSQFLRKPMYAYNDDRDSHTYSLTAGISHFIY